MNFSLAVIVQAVEALHLDEVTATGITPVCACLIDTQDDWEVEQLNMIIPAD